MKCVHGVGGLRRGGFMNRACRVVAVAAFLVGFFPFSAAARQGLSFEERVEAQEAIERVYYSRRIWPKENVGSKPPFEQMVPRALLEAKVADYLKQSAALETIWRLPLGPAQLQAEMDRMARGSRDPDTLLEHSPPWATTRPSSPSA